MSDNKTQDILNTCDTFVALLPPHKAGLYIEHNPHKDYYQTVDAFVSENDDLTGETEWATGKCRELAIKNDELWELRWYPRTPVGYEQIYASSFGALLSAVSDINPQ